MNRPQSANQTPALPAHEQQALPPFWELEDLLSNGADRETALAVMAARRARPLLVKTGSAAGSAASAWRSRLGVHFTFG